MGAGISAGTAALIAGGVGAAGSVTGALISSQGAKQAASTEAQAQGTQLQLAAPYIGYGEQTGNELLSEIMTPTNPTGILGVAPSVEPSPTSSNLTQMPGYKFTQQQGLLATQNAAAAQGLGVSGNALAAAGQYATGLASQNYSQYLQNYQQYFNDFWANQQNRYNMLSGLTTMGANASVGAGSNISSTAAGEAAAQTSAAQATGSGLSGAASSLGNATLTNALLANQTGTTINPNSAAAGQYASELPAQGFLGQSY